MTELSGFSAIQPVTQIAPQALQLPTSMAEVCECESGCGASRILKGFTQIVKAGLTNLIEIDVHAVPTEEGVQVTVIPWDKDGVAKNGAAVPGGFVVIDGSKVRGMSPEEHAVLVGEPLPEPEPQPEPEDEPPPA